MKRFIALGAALALSGNGAPVRAQTHFNGAGATAPYPLLAKWFEIYEPQTGVKINYQATGRSGGLKQLEAKNVDFAVADVPLDAATRAALPDRVREIPLAAHAIAVVYNLPESQLRLSGEVLADIYGGKIRRWNDARLRALNPGATLPNRVIYVMNRSDGSASTWAFTQFLNASSTKWRREPGAGNVKWPLGSSAKSGESFHHRIKDTLGSIGYVEATYAAQTKLQMALIRNRDGAFVRPDLTGLNVALVLNPPRALGTAPSVVNPRGAAAYPIVVVSSLVLPAKPTFEARNHQVRHFARWVLENGQSYNTPLLYAPLPASWREHARRELEATP